MRPTLAPLLLILLLLGTSSSSLAATDRLPDLAMARLRDLVIDQPPDGRRLLRFTAEIINIGDGPFQLDGRRASVAEQEITTVEQRIFDSAGGSRVLPTSAMMHFAGDGHTHWHVRDLEEYTLTSLDGSQAGTGAKSGFCFWDNRPSDFALPGAPTVAQYTSCGAAQSLQVTMGLSVGWGDVYPWSLPDQYIDITGLAPGIYRLRAEADPENWFVERDDQNNATWIDLEIDAQGLRIVGYRQYLSQIARP
jgi:hypothetical protein